MKVDKRHRMYGIANANYCVNMSCKDYGRLSNELLADQFGQQYSTNWFALMHRDDEVPVVKDWYLEQDGEVMTLYFPTLEMENLCEHLLTMARLKYPK